MKKSSVATKFFFPFTSENFCLLYLESFRYKQKKILVVIDKFLMFSIQYN